MEDGVTETLLTCCEKILLTFLLETTITIKDVGPFNLSQSFFTQSKHQSFSCSCGQRTFPVMHDALNSSLASSMMTITATVVEQLFIRCFYLGREQIKLSMVCCTCDTNDPLTLQ